MATTSSAIPRAEARPSRGGEHGRPQGSHAGESSWRPEWHVLRPAAGRHGAVVRDDQRAWSKNVGQGHLDFSSYSKADWRGKIQHDLSVLGADQALQSKSSLMNMARPPVKDFFLDNNQYLPSLNNINQCNWFDVGCHYTKLRHKRNFLRLTAAHFFASPQDGVVGLWQHSLLGQYSEVDSLEEIETKFESLTVVHMRDTVEYREDTYGLRSLDERGGLHLTTVPGGSHNCWLARRTNAASGDRFGTSSSTRRCSEPGTA
ncbi:unnamed protein product [Phytophthora lilii]|uniref:Unnamed protein product n=1 Tax=Phytophthora lilii TaxID=2077276 RepID=A0A9W6WVG6_9STRA|nr:unnamed protein product [Phytophthora lilii]